MKAGKSREGTKTRRDGNLNLLVVVALEMQGPWIPDGLGCLPSHSYRMGQAPLWLHSTHLGVVNKREDWARWLPGVNRGYETRTHNRVQGCRCSPALDPSIVLCASPGLTRGGGVEVGAEDAGASAGSLQQRPTSTLKSCRIKQKTSLVKRSVESDRRRWLPCQHPSLSTGGMESLGGCAYGQSRLVAPPLSVPRYACSGGREPEQPGCGLAQTKRSQIGPFEVAAPNYGHQRARVAATARREIRSSTRHVHRTNTTGWTVTTVSSAWVGKPRKPPQGKCQPIGGARRLDC